MKHKDLPVINTEGLKADFNRVDESIYSRWRDINVRNEAQDDNNTISILEFIGQGFFEDGFTAKRMSAALRSIGKDQDVTVVINSPGGSVFEGLAIYNMLIQHEGKVSVRVIGMAASIAAIIAMAGDEIEISAAGFIMIHAVWSCVFGNRHDMMDVAETLATFDAAITDVLHARSGYDRAEIEQMLLKDTWLSGGEAVEKGFADKVMPAKTVKKDEGDKEKKARALAKRSIENALASAGYTRKQREEIFKSALDGRDAVQVAARDAGSSEEDLKSLLKTIKGD